MAYQSNSYSPSAPALPESFGQHANTSQRPNTGHHSSVPPYGYYPNPSNGFNGGAFFPPGTHPEVIRSFQMVDKDRSGFIDQRELQAALSSGYQRFSLRTIGLLMFLFSKRGDASKIGPDEFAALWNCLGEWRAIFQRFDRDRSGEIDSMELRDALLSLGYAVPPSVLQLLISKYDDRNGLKGALNFDSFVECGMIVKGLTEKFKEKDPRYTGSATLSYDTFIQKNTIKTGENPMPDPVSSVAPHPISKWPTNLKQTILSELCKQRDIAVPMVVMNLTWFAKMAISTAFLGRLGNLYLAGGTLGLTFANVTGFSVLSGLSGAMEPICGQAFGAGNRSILHKTLLMTILLLLFATLPISLLWLNVDKIFLLFGLQKEISIVAKTYLLYLLPDLLVTSLLCPLKAYLTSQCVAVPIMVSTAVAVVLHVPINLLLLKSKGLAGVSLAVCLTDFNVVFLLVLYVFVVERREKDCGEKEGGGWWDQGLADWGRLVKLCGPCCLNTCLEWWCIEILVLLTGRLSDAGTAVSVLAIVLNADYLLYGVMLSLATSASTRIANELGANRSQAAYEAAMVSLATSIVAGCLGGAAMMAGRSGWGLLFSHDQKVVQGVKRMMMLMGVIEIVNFPLAVCGGMVRGTARPWLGLYGNLGGFYLLALPIGVVLGFRVGLGLEGLLLGFLVGMVACAVLLVGMVLRIDWIREAIKAQERMDVEEQMVSDGGDLQMVRKI